MVISSSDGHDSMWNTSVVKALLNSETIEQVNYKSMDEYRHMYKMNVELLGTSEEKALQVVSEYMAIQNASLLADASVEADENGNFIYDENGHAKIMLFDDGTTGKNVIRPFFNDDIDKSVAAVFEEYIGSDDEISLPDIQDMMSLADCGLFTNLMEATDTFNKLNEELSRFVIEYPEFVNENNPQLCKIADKINSNESYRALVENNIKLKNQLIAAEKNPNSNSATPESEMIYSRAAVIDVPEDADFEEKYPTLSSVAKNSMDESNKGSAILDFICEHRGEIIEHFITDSEAVIEEFANLQVDASWTMMEKAMDIYGSQSAEWQRIGSSMEVLLPRAQKFAQRASRVGKGLVVISGVKAVYDGVKTSIEGNTAKGCYEITTWAASQIIGIGASAGTVALGEMIAGSALALLAITNPIAAGVIVVGGVVAGILAGMAADSFFEWLSNKLFGAQNARVPVDPLIIDLGSDGFNIEKRSLGSYFDLNCDGFAEKINWTTRDGILALDLNNNGRIDDGREVFGDYHEIADGISGS